MSTVVSLKIDVSSHVLEAFEKLTVMVGEKIEDMQRQIDELKSGNIISKEIDRQLMPGGKLAK